MPRFYFFAKRWISCFFLLLIAIAASAQCALTISGTTTNALCKGTASGSISITISGGSNAYDYTWISGTQVWHSQNLTGVPAGYYTVYVNDHNNASCTSSSTFEIREPEALSISYIQKATYNGADLTCPDAHNGSFTINATGGTAPYSYSIDGINFQSDNVISNLGAGTYYAIVKDANGCLVTNNLTSGLPIPENYIIPPVTINPPLPLLSDSIIVNPTSVLPTGASSYTIYLGYGAQALTLYPGNTTGGTGSYSYNWTPIAGIADPTSYSVMVAPTVTTTYTLTISDLNHCTTSNNVTINVVNISSGTNTPSNSGNNYNKGSVMICHNGHSLWVARRAVNAHLKHGDYLGGCLTTTALQTTEKIGLDTQPEWLHKKISISPNPSYGRFTVILNNKETIKSEIQLLNAMGQILERKSVQTNHLFYTLQNKAAGIYYLKVIGSDGSLQTAKLIVR